MPPPSSTATSFSTQRESDFGVFFVLPDEYPQLRTLYSQSEASGRQSAILKSNGSADAATAACAGHS